MAEKVAENIIYQATVDTQNTPNVLSETRHR